MAGSQSGSSQADSSQSEMSLGERIADLAFSWQTIHEFLSDSPQSVKEKYKARGFELYFYESFNGLPEPADDAAATFSFKAHYPGDENKATEVLTKSHEALRPHLEAASDACYAGNLYPGYWSPTKGLNTSSSNADDIPCPSQRRFEEVVEGY